MLRHAAGKIVSMCVCGWHLDGSVCHIVLGYRIAQVGRDLLILYSDLSPSAWLFISKNLKNAHRKNNAFKKGKLGVILSFPAH